MNHIEYISSIKEGIIIELENEEIHIVLRHYKIYSTVEKTFTKKIVALQYAADMDKFEKDNLPEQARGYHTVVTSKSEINYDLKALTKR